MAIIVNTDSFRDRAPTGAELIAAERTRQINMSNLDEVQLKRLTRKVRPSAQARVLTKLGIASPNNTDTRTGL